MINNIIGRKKIDLFHNIRRKKFININKNLKNKRLYVGSAKDNISKETLKLNKDDVELMSRTISSEVYEKGYKVLDEWIKKSFQRRYEMAKATSFIDIDNENTSFRAANLIVDNIPGIAIDVYGKYGFIHVYSRHLEPFLYDIGKSVQYNNVRKIDGVYIVDRTEIGESKRKKHDIDPYEPLPVLSQIFSSKYKSVCISGRKAPNHSTIVEENNAKFSIVLNEGPSLGLYLDQRRNRQKVLEYLLSIPGEHNKKTFLNTFCYTCSFSIFPALHGIKTVNVDVSNVALNRAKENFKLNNINTNLHEFIHDDVFTTLHKFNKERKQFDAILLDPPTVSHVKQKKTRRTFTFSTNENYADLVALSLPLVKPGGYLFAFVNTHSIDKEKWRNQINRSIEYVIKEKVKSREESNFNQIRKTLRKMGVRKKIRQRLLKKIDFTIPEDLVRQQYTFEEIEYLTQDIDFPYIQETSLGHYLHGLVFQRKISDVKIQTPPLPKITDDMLHPKKLLQKQKYNSMKQKKTS